VAEPAPARSSRWLVAALCVASVAVLAAGAAWWWARGQQASADEARARVEHMLVRERAPGTADRLAETDAAIEGVRPQLVGLPAQMGKVADLAQQDATLVQAALDAGAKGDVAAYNQAVAQRNALAPQVDAAQEQLRVDGNRVLDALARVTNRTSR
jgi:cytochrome c5